VKERLPDIPVILVSGEPPSDSVDAARRAGVAKFLIKPLLPSQVARAVDEILGLD
jgi:DNA-binding NtrC family response regulator